MFVRSCRGISTLLIVLFVSAVIVLGLVAFASSRQGQAQETIKIVGAGASFPYPLISKWIHEYNKVNPSIQIVYQPIGSGGGRTGLFGQVFHFAGSDAPATDEELGKYDVVHIPETIGGVVVAYNIPQIPSGLNLTADILALIFMANITRWNDPRIAAINPDLALPDKEIVTVHRSDSSGTTYVFTDYLSNASTVWNLGRGTTVSWPSGLGGLQNFGVASIIQQTQYSVGYLEYFYAKNNSIPYARIQNREGHFVEPTLSSIANAAAVGVPLLQKDIRSSIVNLPGENVYPISSFTYFMVWRNMSYMEYNRAKAVVDFMWWVIHDGQNYSEALFYPRLPKEVVRLNEETMRELYWGGAKLLR